MTGRTDVGVSDADIIGKTEFVQNEQGHTKFKYALPSGRVIESEWLNDDQRKKAREAWLNVVCDQIVLDREEQKAKDKRVVEERKLKETAPVPEMKPGSIIVTDGPPLNIIPNTGMGMLVSTSPDEYVRGQLKLAMLRHATASDALVLAEREFDDAAESVKRWNKLNDALGA
jgi:hypothetical protein